MSLADWLPFDGPVLCTWEAVQTRADSVSVTNMTLRSDPFQGVGLQD